MVSVNGSAYQADDNCLRVPADSLVTAYATGAPERFIDSDTVTATYDAAPPAGRTRVLPPIDRFHQRHRLPNRLWDRLFRLGGDVDSYHEERNHYAPGRVETVAEHLEYVRDHNH